MILEFKTSKCCVQSKSLKSFKSQGSQSMVFPSLSIQFHVHSRNSIHDGLLFIISAQMCAIQRHVLKFKSLISLHLSQIFILFSNVFKWYSHLYKMFWPAYIITLNLPNHSGNYIVHKLEHSKTLCCTPSVFMHCVSIPT